MDPRVLVPFQHFVCSGDFKQKQCTEEVAEFRKMLSIYPVARLGNWTWVLVRASEWKEIMASRGLDPDSPAFSFLPKRETFIEDSLLKPVPVRNRELLLKWNLSIPALLDFAIRHELGHALCNYTDERAADEVADSLKQREAIICKQPSMARKRR